MAFMKRSLGVTQPVSVDPRSLLSPEVGDMRVEVEEGLEVWKVWAGERWVTEEEWKAQRMKER